MRKIKFRVWDKQIKEWLAPENPFPSLIRNIHSTEFIYFTNNLNYDVEQFTGLKDCNDREIYEGDIISHNFYLNKWTLGEIVYDESIACFKIKNGLELTMLITLGNLMQEDETPFRMNVIGHIHEFKNHTLGYHENKSEE